jgi:hypothetical protein
MRTLFVIARIGFSLLIGAAVVGQLIVTYNYVSASNAAGVPTAIINFLSFFTIQSNVIAAVTLFIGAVLLWRAKSIDEPEPRWFAVLLAAATTYMLTTGVVYNVLLRGVELPQGSTLGWSNEVLHLVAPLYMLVDLLFAPRRRSLAWKTIFVIIAYPIVWVTYTLIRGPLTTAPLTGEAWWYPYPFLNPHVIDGGYGGVAMYVVGIAVVISAVAALVIWCGRRRGKDAAL